MPSSLPLIKADSQEGLLNNRAGTDLTPLFYPQNIAVIGVSHNKVGGIKYIVAHEVSGFSGGLYPINPNYQEIDGRRIYPSLEDPDVPDIDLAIIAVPAPNVPDVVRDCHRKGVKFAIIFSSGFEESGRDDLDRELRAAIAEGPTRIVGPNCLGVFNQESRVNFYYAMSFDLPGNISFVSQSGGTTARLLVALQSMGIGLQNAVSIGNSIDVSIGEMLLYFKDDPKTGLIVLYMENMEKEKGPEFLAALQATTRVKPVIIWKGGQTDVGIKAAKSHTGGLAGSYRIWQAALRQYGVIVAENFEEMRDFAAAMSIHPPLPRGNRVGIVLSGGGIGVEFADAICKQGLEVPELTAETQAKLAEYIPDINSSFRNPVDLGEYGYVPTYYGQALKAIAEDANVDAILTVREPERSTWFENSLQLTDFDGQNLVVLKSATEVGKPIFMNLSPNSELPEDYAKRYNFRKRLMLEDGIPTIDYTPHAAKLLKQMAAYQRYLSQFE
ncbi:MAG TPA: CoA-binding protein [Candidatus Lokiarchaeia archaeon]|nr:CoA-binding protein [Candidatus Lokiarchaeia archaeon]